MESSSQSSERVDVLNEGGEIRLDSYLSSRFPERSRSLLQSLIRGGSIRLNGQVVKKAERVRSGDRITVDWPTDDVASIEPDPSIRLHVLFEDSEILVINKPPDLTVHPGAGNSEGTLIHALLGYDYETYQAMLDAALRPGIVHRLDKDTSGVLLIAKNETAKCFLIDAFKAKTVSKVYLALVAGKPPRSSGTITNFIGRSPRNRKKMAVVGHHGKAAESSYRVLSSGNSGTLVEVSPLTGRTHQIRIHMKHIGCPVIGDKLYSHRREATLRAPRQMLHAWKIKFPHPKTTSVREFVAPIPDDFESAAAELAIQLRDLEALQ